MGNLDSLETLEEDPICEWVAKNLKRLRGKRHLSLDALPRQCGVSRAMLVQIESGRSVPSIKVLLSNALGPARAAELHDKMLAARFPI